MKITVLFFSIFREKTGFNELTLGLGGSSTTVADALAELFASFEELRSWESKMLIAVNCEYADGTTVLQDGDELALMPPVQGG
ncbi:MAG: MoaD/ThiS family protein [Verrucomicrobiales bacterium]|nr:MoaD/ThiS family protein [bacterium]MDF2376069.1 MoaD/ThiS family protein [Verrucomicrobiales bacterium]